jgi:hypothetical protein
MIVKFNSPLLPCSAFSPLHFALYYGLLNKTYLKISQYGQILD